jgi:pheromone shutdown-related protein TraB
LIEKVTDRIVLVGTAHVSKKSVEEVHAAITQFKPAVVGVELDKGRYEALRDRVKWRQTPITEVIRSGRAYFFLAQLFLWSFQRKLAEKFGVEPGAEMIAAVNRAHEGGLKLALLDRDIGVTLKRAWRMMTLREKLRFVWAAWETVFGLAWAREQAKGAKPVEEEIDLERMMNEDVLTEMMEEIGKFAPSVKRVLIDERDQYIAKKALLAAKEGTVVVVIGAGHLRGVRAAIQRGLEGAPKFEDLKVVPTRAIPWGAVVGWSIPMAFFWMIVYYALQGGLARAGEALLWWWVITGALAALGCALARGHPYSTATAFAVAGFTTLHPALAAGWISGFVEARVRTPTVADFERLQAWETLRDFMRNPVTRVLFVVALTNLGATVGTIVALPVLARGLG